MNCALSDQWRFSHGEQATTRRKRLRFHQFLACNLFASFRSVLSWNVGTPDDINESTLSLFCILEPKIDVLVIGVGDADVTPSIAKRIMSFTRKYKINVEILTTESACATFNFLNAEQRMVAGAFIPPTTLRLNENDMMNAQRRNNELYEMERLV